MLSKTTSAGRSKQPLRSESLVNQYPKDSHLIIMDRKEKMLLILDLNKVLVHRRKRRRTFHTRPYAKEFILGMSQRFQVAVWTSCSEKNGQQIVQSLFSDIDLLFVWYCDRCVRTQVPICGNKGDTDVTARSSSAATSMEDQEDFEEIKLTSLKPLMSVWSEFPQYSQYNTLLVDDSAEKCYENPPHNCVHPLPYVFFSDDDVDDETKKERKKMNKKQKKRKMLALESGIFTGGLTNSETGTETDTAESQLLQGDTELRPGGALWCYLDHIARTWQQAEVTDLAVIVAEVGAYQSPTVSNPITSGAASGLAGGVAGGLDQSIPVST